MPNRVSPMDMAAHHRQGDIETGGRPHAAYAVPNEPLVVIEPSKSRISLHLSDVWAYRELLYFLVWRDLKVRYKQTVLGAAWVVLQPLMATIVFSVFFGRLAGIAS